MPLNVALLKLHHLLFPNTDLHLWVAWEQEVLVAAIQSSTTAEGRTLIPMAVTILPLAYTPGKDPVQGRVADRYQSTSQYSGQEMK